MYPNLYYACKDWFGVQWNPLRFISSFGVLVAFAFMVAIWILRLELLRKAKEGLLGYEEETITFGKPLKKIDLLLNFLIGFVFGYKFFGMLLSNASNPEDYIFSRAGNWLAGILLGLFIAGLKWHEVKKNQMPEPEERKIKIWPHDRVGPLAFLAMIFGFAGAKIFNSLENWNDFLNFPLQSLLSFSGLTFYGGLICAALAIWWYAKKHRISIWHLNDAAAPALMLAYAVGRIGCQVAGDGDWGIPNSAYISAHNGKLIPSSVEQFNQAVRHNQDYFSYVFGSLGRIRHFSLPAPSFLPDWLFAYSYPHNVNDIGLRLANCTGEHCAFLPVPVFPTPVYETLLGTLFFCILWSLRKRLKVAGTLFSVYLILNGIERFFIEKIRVNSTYNLLGFRPTQAELIALALVILGLVCYFQLSRKAKLLE